MEIKVASELQNWKEIGNIVILNIGQVGNDHSRNLL